MKYIIEDANTTRQGKLIYYEDDYSFITDIVDEEGISEILINFMQLCINEEGLILYVIGHCPLSNYIKTSIYPKNITKKDLRAVLSEELIPGISLSDQGKRNLPLYINKTKGWVCIGNPDEIGDQMVEFAPGSVATIKDNEIAALWLHPEKLPKNL